MELIGALLHWPKVIFLDEPTIGLDVLAAEKLRDFLKVFNQQEKATIILTSHNMDDIERLCSRVMILKTGEMIFDGSPSKLLNEGECRLRTRFKESFRIDDLAAITGIPASKIKVESVSGSEGEGDPQAESENTESEETKEEAIPTFYFETHKDAVIKILQSLMAKATILDMGIEEQSLESVISRIYSEGGVRPDRPRGGVTENA